MGRAPGRIATTEWSPNGGLREQIDFIIKKGASGVVAGGSPWGWEFAI